MSLLSNSGKRRIIKLITKTTDKYRIPNSAMIVMIKLIRANPITAVKMNVSVLFLKSMVFVVKYPRFKMTNKKRNRVKKL